MAHSGVTIAAWCSVAGAAGGAWAAATTAAAGATTGSFPVSPLPASRCLGLGHFVLEPALENAGSFYI